MWVKHLCSLERERGREREGGELERESVLVRESERVGGWERERLRKKERESIQYCCILQDESLCYTVV